ncbi:hypothetical protein Tco_1131881 [Tanacetum coccineum]|uniref:Reverse transcriptase Ty1/copia-type domain-containing protein n=1 Tax=Tanacetum coccineum TaxID=301880 RepID=A0ABQ5JC23_9ASTR
MFNWQTATFEKVENYEDEDDCSIDFETEFPAIVFDNTFTAIPSEPMVCPPNEKEVDFRISLDESDDEDFTVIFDENSFSYKIISVNDLKMDLGNDKPLSPNPTVDYFDDLDYFKDFENEFPAIVYNDGLMSKSDLEIKPLVSSERIDKFNLIDEASLSQYDEEIVSRFNDLFNIIHPDDLKSKKDNDDNDIGIIQSSEGQDMAPLPAADQRHPWLRYQIEEYNEGIRHSYEHRLEKIWSRSVNRVHVLDFEGLTPDMRQDLAVRLRMVYSGEGQQVMSNTEMGLDVADTLCFQLGGVRRRMTWRQFILALGLHTEQEIAEAGEFLGPAPSYIFIRDPVRRLCHRMIAYSISGMGQTPEKMIDVDLFYLRIMDRGTTNISHLLAQYLFRHAEGRKSKARLSGGHFIRRLVMHFGLVSDEGLRGMDQRGSRLLRLEIPAPAQAPPPPPPAPQPRLQGVVESFTIEQSRVSTWLISCMTQLMDVSIGIPHRARDGRGWVRSLLGWQHANGRKSGARLSGGHFIGRLAMHFGLVSDEGLRGLQRGSRLPAAAAAHEALVDLEKPLVKDGDVDDVDVHLYRSMIRSLMYLIASRLDIMFAVCACARFQVTPKISHLLAIKRIFRYLKGKPTLGLWYFRDSSFELVAYTDSDYVGATQDRKFTTGGCQFLGNRLISWQCKKQTVVATSTTEAKYGEVEIKSIVDGHDNTITEVSVRSSLQLAYADGISNMFTTKIFEQLALMGFKSTGWDQLGSNIDTALILIDDATFTSLDVDTRGAATTDISLDAGQGSVKKVEGLETELKNTSRSMDEADLPAEDSSKQGRMIENYLVLILLSFTTCCRRFSLWPYIRRRRDVNTGSKGVNTAGDTVNVMHQNVNILIPSSSLKDKDPGQREEVAQKLHVEELAKDKAGQEQEKYDLEKALELQKQLDERQEVVVEEAHDIDWSDPAMLRYHALQNRPFSIVEDQNHTFIPKDSEIEKEVMKRPGFDLQQESIKKNEKTKALGFVLKQPAGEEKEKKKDAESSKQVEEEIVQQEDVVAEQVVKESSKKAGGRLKRKVAKARDDKDKRQKMQDDPEKLTLMEYVEVISDSEEIISVIPLAVKSPIVNWKSYCKGDVGYYEIHKADGSYKTYIYFSEMLNDHDKEDLIVLYRLFNEKYASTRQVWKNHHSQELIEWKLYDSCGVHSLMLGEVSIHMLVEKKYPLPHDTLTRMLQWKLHVNYNVTEMAYELLRACALRNFDLEVMEFESAQSNTTAKLPILKLGEYEMWVIRIKQYFQVQDYALWEVIENGNSWVSVPQTTQENGSSVTKMSVPATAEEKTNKKNDVKARSLLLMALPNEHQLTFSQYSDAKTMFAAIET